MPSVACRGCGVQVECAPKMKPRKWCSEYCRIKTYYELHPEKKAKQAARALERNRQKASLHRKTCARCGQVKGQRRGRFCSRTKECIEAARAEYQPCSQPGCGRPVNGRGLCRTHYQQWWRENNRDRARARARKGNSARKAMLAGAVVEDVAPMRVFELDGWRCHLCGKRINRRLRWPHLLSATIDHVVPLSKGGAHSYENCRAAHYSCNAAKCNRGVGEQLVLAVS